MPLLMYSLYFLSSSEHPDSVRYVGITKDPDQRLGGHLRAARDLSKTNHRVNWIRSVVAAGHQVLMRVVRDGLTEEAAKAMEVSAIAERRSAGADLVNSTDGGDGVRGYTFTAEARRKISIAGLGRRQTPESIERTAAAHRGKFVSAETRRKIADAARSISDETRAKMAASARNSSPEKRQRIAKRVSEINRLNPPLRGGFKGVSHRNDVRKPRRARINPGDGERLVGWFDTPEEAARAYDAAAFEAWGEACYLNFPKLQAA